MLRRSFKPAKCKTSCKLATSRLKLMKNKKGVVLSQMKRDLAHLLESGQDQTARIRVEHVIREEKTLAAFELLEIYCELIVARMPVIESQKNCAIDLKEAVTSVIFAAPRCADIPELLDVKKYLTAKYGKEFATAAIELRPDCGVSRMLIEKLSAVAPDGPTKIKVLKAIAEEHNIEWEPKAFGEKDAKPPDDLLNGPTGFEKASTMHMGHPKFQAPPSQEQKHQEPINYYVQNRRFSMGPQDSASKDTDVNQSSSGTSHDVRPDFRPESRNSERTEMRQSFQGESNSRPNWNMGFTDAASAAQAAAESAEMASMAARAAAQLSIQGRISRQHSSDSHKSFTCDSRDENQARHAKESSSNQSFHDTNPNSRPENHVSSNLSVKKDDGRSPNFKQNYSSKSRESSKVDGLGAERNPKLQNERVEKQEPDSYLERAAEMSTKNTKTGQRQGFYRKSSFEDDVATTSYSETSIKNPNKEPEYQESYEPENMNPFGGEKFEKKFSSDSFVEHIQESNNNSSNDDEEEDYENTVVFDEYKLEESRMSFDVDPTYDEVESTNSYFRSPDKIPSMGKSNSDDFGPVNFDDSARPKFDSEDEFEESSRIRAEEIHSPSETKARFDFDDVRTEPSVVEEPNYSPSKTKPRFDFDDVRTELSVAEEPNNLFSREDTSSGADDGTGLGFTPLTGGFRNKGYRLPPYKKSADGPAATNQKSDVTNVRSSFKSTELQNSDEKLKSILPTDISDSKTDLKSDVNGVKSSFKPTEIRKPDVKLSPVVPTGVSDSDSDPDDFTQEFQLQNPMDTNFHDSTDSDDDMQVNIPSNRTRFGSGLSRRTKGPTIPSSSGSGVRTRPESQSQSQSQPLSDSIGKDPNQLEKHVTSEPYTERKFRTQIASTSSRSRAQLRAESPSQNLPKPHSEDRVENIASPKPFKNQLGLEMHAAPEPVPEPKVQSRRPSSRYKSQSQNKADHKPSYEPKPPEARNRTHRDSLGSEKHSSSKPVTEPKVRISEESSVSKSEKKLSLNREDSGSNNGSVSHVHPKLPDYDDVFARFQALRENRK